MFWIDADVAEGQLQRRFHGILHTIKPETPDLLVLREQFRAVHNNDVGFTEELRRRLGDALHEMPSEKSLLFVIDNVPEAPAGIPPKPLETWCPAMGKASVLATSRAKLMGNKGVIALPVETLDRKSAVALLTYGVDRKALEEAEWERIAKGVGDLPLALELLQQALAAGAISPRELFDRSSQLGTTKELDNLMERFGHRFRKGHFGELRKRCRFLMRGFRTGRRSWLVFFLSFRPKPIPMAIIDALRDDNAPAEASAALIARSFVTPVPGGTVPFFGKMHRVLADFLRGCSDARDVESGLVEKALNDVMDSDKCRDPKSWPLMNACLPHAEWLFGQFDEDSSSEYVRPIVGIGRSIGILLSAQGSLHRPQVVEEQASEIARRKLGEEHPETLTSMNNLAETLRNQGSLDRARELHEQLLNTRRRVFGDASQHFNVDE